MTNITITIPDSIAARVLDSFCVATGYDGRISQIEWAQRRLLELVMYRAKAQEGKAAMEAARSNAMSRFDSEVVAMVAKDELV